MLSIYLILLAALGPGAYTAFDQNKYQGQRLQMFLGSRLWLVHEIDNLTAILEPNV
jgi:hypothetical protein